MLSALQGEARREILLLLPAERDTPAKIFRALEGLYGEKATIVQLRAHFFTCNQQTGEGVGMFILRLRECLARWRAREPRPDDDDGDEMLRSQLVAGLRPGPVQVELQKLLRRNPTLKFADVSMEAKAVEQDHHAEEASARSTFMPPTAPVPVKSVDEWREVREALKAEVLAKVNEQMSTHKESILGEIQQQFRENQHPQPQPGPRGGPNRSNWGNQGRRQERPLR